MRFCTRHRGKTPIACSLEPSADVRTTVLLQLNRDGALGPTAAEDYLISEKHDDHAEKSRRLAFSVQDSFLINNTVNRYGYRMLQNS